jgi:hypothetical protein
MKIKKHSVPQVSSLMTSPIKLTIREIPHQVRNDNTDKVMADTDPLFPINSVSWRTMIRHLRYCKRCSRFRLGDRNDRVCEERCFKIPLREGACLNEVQIRGRDLTRHSPLRAASQHPVNLASSIAITFSKMGIFAAFLKLGRIHKYSIISEGDY